MARLNEAASATRVVPDVTSGESMDGLTEALVAPLGGLDLLVSRHGVTPRRTASGLTAGQLPEWFQRIVVPPGARRADQDAV